MNTAHRSTLRQVMTLAWRKFRYELGRIDFAASLRHAWAWVKGEAARAEQSARYAAAPAKREVAYRHTAQSAIRRSLTGQAYAYTRFAEAGRLTSRLGC